MRCDLMNHIQTNYIREEDSTAPTYRQNEKITDEQYKNSRNKCFRYFTVRFSDVGKTKEILLTKSFRNERKINSLYNRLHTINNTIKNAIFKYQFEWNESHIVKSMKFYL